MKLRTKRHRLLWQRNRYGSLIHSYWGKAHCKKEDRDLNCPNCAAYDFLDNHGRFPYSWEEMYKIYMSNFNG